MLSIIKKFFFRPPAPPGAWAPPNAYSGFGAQHHQQVTCHHDKHSSLDQVWQNTQPFCHSILWGTRLYDLEWSTICTLWSSVQNFFFIPNCVKQTRVSVRDWLQICTFGNALLLDLQCSIWQFIKTPRSIGTSGMGFKMDWQRYFKCFMGDELSSVDFNWCK